MAAEPPKRIVVVQTAFLGDVVLTTPLFRALKRVYPESRLTALVTPQAAPLIEEDPHLDALLTYAKKGGEPFSRVLSRVRSGGFDLLVSPHRSHRSALLSLLSGVRLRVGFAGSAVPFAYHRRVRLDPGLHEVDRNLSLLRGIGETPLASDRVLCAGYGETEAEEVRAVLAEAGVSAGERLAGLCAGSVWATKRWLPEGFAAVGRGLVERGYRPLLLGGPDDREVSVRVAGLIGPAAVAGAGRTSLKALAAWMDRVSILVTNDSAPLHVAAARGTPTVAVFGATTTGLGFGPFHPRSRVVEVPLRCRPCGRHGGARCPEGHFRCMRDVTPAAVLGAVDELLGAEGG